MAPHQGQFTVTLQAGTGHERNCRVCLGRWPFDSELYNREKSAVKAKPPILLHRARPRGEARGPIKPTRSAGLHVTSGIPSKQRQRHSGGSKALTLSCKSQMWTDRSQPLESSTTLVTQRYQLPPPLL